jgi:CBS domain-containing protein
MNTRDIKVRDVMSRGVKTLGRRDTLYVADERMAMEKIRHLPVVDQGRVVGVVAQSDLIQLGQASALGFATVGQKKLLRAIDVSEAMSEPPITISPEATVHEAGAAMLENEVGCLPVVESGRLVGIVTQGDLLRSPVGSTATATAI